MPTVSPDSPADFTPFPSEEYHVKHHRSLEAQLEAIGAAGTDAYSFNTVSTLVLVANRIGLGGAVPTTSSTAAAIKGFFRTAASINIAVPSMSTNSVTSITFSAATQVGNAIQVGDSVEVIPLAAWPAGVVLGNAYVVDTNSITVWWRAISGINATATVAVHVFTTDLT